MRKKRIVSNDEKAFLDSYNPKAYECPSITADIIIFTMRYEKLNVLLVRRGQHPFKGCWAIPGGFVGIDESCEQAAYRELQEETGIHDVYLEQLYTFSDPSRDPRMRVISTAYIALVSASKIKLHAGDDAMEAAWFEVNTLLADLEEQDLLAFDHEDILRLALQRLRGKLYYSNVAFQLVNDTFTFKELQNVYEQILNKTVYSSNLKRDLKNSIIATGQMTRTKGRPAELYREKKAKEGMKDE